MNENEIRLKEKLDFFMDEEVKVHVKLRDKTFLNGFIKSKIRDGVYWFEDRVLEGVYIFLKDVYEVHKFDDKEARG